MARHTLPEAEPANAGSPLPFDMATWAIVVEELGLCRQQARVVQLVLKGQSDRQIAKALGLSEPTVRTYLGRVFLRLGVHSRIELILRVVSVAWRHRQR